MPAGGCDDPPAAVDVYHVQSYKKTHSPKRSNVVHDDVTPFFSRQESDVGSKRLQVNAREEVGSPFSGLSSRKGAPFQISTLSSVLTILDVICS